MKMNKIYKWLLSWGVDRWAHCAIAGMIACVMLLAMCWLPAWATLLSSVMVTLGYIMGKEMADEPGDIVDALFGIVGALPVWVLWVVMMMI